MLITLVNTLTGSVLLLPLWVESDLGPASLVHKGQTLKGDILPVSRQACFLDASKRHCVLDWEGERIVLACFLIKDFDKLFPKEKDQLFDLGFWLPLSESVANTGSAPATRAKAKAAPPNKQKFALEVCCGTAGLTAEIRKQGLPCSFGIDHVIKAGSKAPIKKIDITVPGSQELVKSWITNGQCCYLHLGIPCGTSSRAREIPGRPPPLRSESSPEGLAGLQPHDAERVKQANSVCSFACSLILLCAQFAVEWSLEQPHSSLFWRTTWWQTVLQHIKPFFVFFANCMHGGARPKRTCLATSVPTLVALSQECDNQHTHLPWGKCGLGWSTAAEVEYPHELCNAITQVQPSAHDQPHAFSSVSTLTQTRKSPTLMPEFKHVQSLHALKPPDLKVPSTLAAPLILSLKSGQVRIPKGCKILDAFPLCAAFLTGPLVGDSMASRESPDLKKEDKRELNRVSDSVHSAKWHQVRVAFPFSPEEFVREAVCRGHPSSVFQGVTEALCKAINASAKMSLGDMIKMRAEFFRHWTMRARALASDEKKLHQSLPPHRREILKDSSLKYARLSIYNPESGRAECFQQYAVPFGARASVVAFIRCARALNGWHCKSSS